mgnify:CR=1 FL=1
MNCARKGSPGIRTGLGEIARLSVECCRCHGSAVQVRDSTAITAADVSGAALVGRCFAFLDSAGADRLCSPPVRRADSTRDHTNRIRGGDSPRRRKMPRVSAVGARLRVVDCSQPCRWRPAPARPRKPATLEEVHRHRDAPRGEHAGGADCCFGASKATLHDPCSRAAATFARSRPACRACMPESSNGRISPAVLHSGLGNTDFDLAASQPVSVVVVRWCSKTSY